MKRSRTLYLLLGSYIASSMTYFLFNIGGLVDGFWIRHGRAPFELDIERLTLTDLREEAQQAGLREGDVVETLNGSPFTGRSQWNRTARHAPPGTVLRVGVGHVDGSRTEAAIVLRPDTQSLERGLVLLIAVGVSVPLLCLLVGYWVAAARPYDRNAWFVLVLLSMPQTMFQFNSLVWPGLWLILLPAWHRLIQTFTPTVLLWFGLFFPQRSRIDKRVPWMKWIFLPPQVLAFSVDLFNWYARGFAPSRLPSALQASAWIGPVIGPAQLLCIILYSVAVLDGFRSAKTADARRRMRVMAAGWGVAFVSLLALIFLLRGSEQEENFAIVFALVGMAMIFPLSVAYVVVVQRAMDVRLLLHMGTKYALARSTIIVLRTVLALAITVFLVRIMAAPEWDVSAVLRLVVLAGLLFLVSSRTRKVSAFIDRKFFREAYNAELVLSELSEQARTFKERTLLLETVIKRVSEVLHVPRIAVFLRGSEVFYLQHAIGLNVALPLALPEESATVRHLVRTNRPATLYRENPQPWLLEANDEERRTLDGTHAELLLPLPGRDRLMGVMALGTKKSEEPYTPTDLRLLQSVAVQTGLALEISELAHSLAREEAQRERIQREIEIAREVQEKLFPQEMPSIPGITLAGACRPAQGVGGDYYDVIPLGEGLLGLAIGDVSGKGISAALMMASLRASLRGMTLYGAGDLAELMRRVNHLVYEASTSNRYATFFFAVFNTARNELRFVNAGHNPPIILREVSNRLETVTLQSGGPVVGLLPGITYTEDAFVMKAGDLLVAYTDGISEAMNARDEEWGEARLMAELQAVREGSAEDILRAVFKSVDAFTGGAVQHDDMTLLVMKLAAGETDYVR